MNNTENCEMVRNRALVSGVVRESPRYSHSCFDEDFYFVLLWVMRESGVYDTVDVIIPERLYPMKNITLGDNLKIDGEYRSKNMCEDGKNKLVLSLFAQNVELIISRTPIYENSICLKGYVCKPVVCRRTPLNRRIADLMLAVNRRSGKSDYIPCILWGRNAAFACDFGVGREIMIRGRIQSRIYKKCVDGIPLEKRACEVSACEVDIIS